MRLSRIIAIVALAVAALVAVSLGPASVPATPGQVFSVAPAATHAACPGPQRLPVGDQGTSGDLAAGTLDRQADDFGDGASYPVGLGRAWEAPLAAIVERVNDGDLEGIAALTCLPARFDSWLAGGSTLLGHSARLILSNPADAPTEVRVTLYGPLGQAGDSFTVAVAPRDQEERLLEGVVAELSALVVHVEASGPGVVAVLQDSRLEGFQPAGTDWVGATQPSTSLVVPSAGSAVEGATTVLRLFAPEGAQVSVAFASEQGVQPWSGARNLALEAGVVTEVPVPVGEPGALQVTANSPVLAAALTVVPRAAEQGSLGAVAYDLHWVPGIAESEQGPVAAIVPVDDAVLVMVAQEATTASFVDGGGAVVVSVPLPAATVVRVPLSLTPGTVLTADGDFYWAIEITTAEGYLASLMPAPVSQADREVTVRPAPYAPVVR